MPELGFGDMPQPAAGDAQPAPRTNADVPTPGGGSPAAAPTFGSMLSTITGAPNYTPPDPQASALDQSASMLDQQVKRAGVVGSNFLTQIFAPEEAAAARAAVPMLTEKLQAIKAQQAAIQAGRTERQVLGLDPSEVPDEATHADRVEAAVAGALQGNLRKFSGLQVADPQRAAAIQDRVHEVMSGHLSKAELAFESLSSMENEGQYRAKVNQLRQDGTLTDLESLGLKVPPSLEAWNAGKLAEGKALREARIGAEALRARIEERSGGVPMEKKEAETYASRLTTESGKPLSNLSWERINGKRVAVVNGMGDIRDLGKKFNFASADQSEALDKASAAAVPKNDIEKYRANNRTYELATKDRDGNALPAGRINTNPNIQQAIAEGLASMLRGGQGGANVGLLKIETAKRGFMQGVFDTILTNYAGALNTLSEKDVRPYLTKLTQSQQRDVLDVLKEYNDASISDRLTPLARQAGELGLNASVLGLGKGEIKGVEDAIEEGRQSTINRFTPRARATSGGDGGIFLDNPPPVLVTKPDDPNAVHPPVPQPVTPPTGQASGVQQPAPSGPTPGGAGPPAGVAPSAQSPVTIWGTQTAIPPMPAGASPDFSSKVQRIENPASIGKRSDAGGWLISSAHAEETPNGKSSASGPFQMINSTWNENKPVGAPNRAKDATPEQNAQAFATLTAKNAATLTGLKIPVNDTTLYIAHNLGAGGAGSLFTASPTSDARSVVGDVVASNNPKFFKGRPTVATVLQRYSDAMGGGGAVSGTANAAPGPGIMSRLGSLATEEAPAIGSTLGAIGGGALGNIPGAVAGGAAGGAAGQSLKDYLQGNEQSPTKVAEQAALGGVLGVSGLPRGLNMLARAGGSGAIEAGAEAVKGGEDSDPLAAGAKGAAEGLGGEMFGRALGMGMHKVYSLFTPNAQKVVREAAKDLHEANETLRTEPDKLPGVGGAAATANPKYEAAEAAKEKAENTIKEMLPSAKPEEVAYAHRVTAEGVPLQEAQAAKPGALEQQRVGAGYQQIENEVGGKGVGPAKAWPRLADGPAAKAAEQKMPPGMQRAAERTEMEITKPAANWQEKWVQLKDARSALLDLERDAMTSTSAGRTQIAKDYRTLADTVRAQQVKAANFVFGPTEGPKVIDRLKMLDTRYRNLMEATNGGNLAGAARLQGEAGREADRKFRAFAAGDPTAVAAWNAMRRAPENVERSVKNIVGMERVPYLGKVYSFAKMSLGFNSWMRERAAGSPAKFSDFIKAGDGGARATRDVLGTAGARAAVQGDDTPPVPGARLAKDGKWYVHAPHANGNYQQVVSSAAAPAR